MSNWNRWPFTPSCLRDLVSVDTLKVIESGLSERIDRPLTILDRDPETGKFTRIESIDELHRYEVICQLLRDKQEGNRLCLDWDDRQADISLEAFLSDGDPFRCFFCHVGLIDMTYIIRVDNHPVAMLFTGQFRRAEDAENIFNTIQAIGTDQAPPFPISESQRPRLHQLVEKLKPLPENIRGILEEQVRVIEQFAEAEFQLRKRRKEQEFLDELRLISTGPLIKSRAELEERLKILLARVKDFLGSSYAVFFSALLENDSVLPALACTGASQCGAQPMPHFNWRKASLPLANFDLNNFMLQPWQPEARSRGIRGENRVVLEDAAQVIPVSFGDRWRGVLLLGPVSAKVDFEKEERFLKEIANTISLFALTSMEMVYLENERSGWRNTARLLTHQFKTALTPITNAIGRARSGLGKPMRDLDQKKIDGHLVRAEDLTLLLADSARETLSGKLEFNYQKDLKIERYPLTVLVANCVNGYAEKAKSQKRDLIMEESIENLPLATIDVSRMTVAIENLIENAIKYSYENTQIIVRSHHEIASDGKGMVTVIEIDDLGYEIRQDETNLIFQLGVRGSNVQSAQQGDRLSGSGLGLWETKSIIDAHGGKLKAICTPTGITRSEGKAYRVVFFISLPLKQG